VVEQIRAWARRGPPLHEHPTPPDRRPRWIDRGDWDVGVASPRSPAGRRFHAGSRCCLSAPLRERGAGVVPATQAPPLRGSA
jgi:hypothetical protein